MSIYRLQITRLSTNGTNGSTIIFDTNTRIPLSKTSGSFNNFVAITDLITKCVTAGLGNDSGEFDPTQSPHQPLNSSSTSKNGIDPLICETVQSRFGALQNITTKKVTSTTPKTPSLPSGHQQSIPQTHTILFNDDILLNNPKSSLTSPNRHSGILLRQKMVSLAWGPNLTGQSTSLAPSPQSSILSTNSTPEQQQSTEVNTSNPHLTSTQLYSPDGTISQTFAEGHALTTKVRPKPVRADHPQQFDPQPLTGDSNQIDDDGTMSNISYQQDNELNHQTQDHHFHSNRTLFHPNPPPLQISPTKPASSPVDDMLFLDTVQYYDTNCPIPERTSRPSSADDHYQMNTGTTQAAGSKPNTTSILITNNSSSTNGTPSPSNPTISQISEHEGITKENLEQRFIHQTQYRHNFKPQQFKARYALHYHTITIPQFQTIYLCVLTTSTNQPSNMQYDKNGPGLLGFIRLGEEHDEDTHNFINLHFIYKQLWTPLSTFFTSTVSSEQRSVINLQSTHSESRPDQQQSVSNILSTFLSESHYRDPITAVFRTKEFDPSKPTPHSSSQSSLNLNRALDQPFVNTMGAIWSKVSSPSVPAPPTDVPVGLPRLNSTSSNGSPRQDSIKSPQEPTSDQTPAVSNKSPPSTLSNHAETSEESESEPTSIFSRLFTSTPSPQTPRVHLYDVEQTICVQTLRDLTLLTSSLVLKNRANCVIHERVETIMRPNQDLDDIDLDDDDTSLNQNPNDEPLLDNLDTNDDTASIVTSISHHLSGSSPSADQESITSARRPSFDLLSQRPPNTPFMGLDLAHTTSPSHVPTNHSSSKFLTKSPDPSHEEQKDDKHDKNPNSEVNSLQPSPAGTNASSLMYPQKSYTATSTPYSAHKRLNHEMNNTDLQVAAKLPSAQSRHDTPNIASPTQQSASNNAPSVPAASAKYSPHENGYIPSYVVPITRSRLNPSRTSSETAMLPTTSNPELLKSQTQFTPFDLHHPLLFQKPIGYDSLEGSEIPTPIPPFKHSTPFYKHESDMSPSEDTQVSVSNSSFDSLETDIADQSSNVGSQNGLMPVHQGNDVPHAVRNWRRFFVQRNILTGLFLLFVTILLGLGVAGAYWRWG